MHHLFVEKTDGGVRQRQVTGEGRGNFLHPVDLFQIFLLYLRVFRQSLGIRQDVAQYLSFLLHLVISGGNPDIPRSDPGRSVPQSTGTYAPPRSHPSR